jgi:glycerol-3-phosphate O-acyltransferase
MNETVSPQIQGTPLPTWPAEAGARIVFLVDCRTATERQFIERWVAQTRPPGTDLSQVSYINLPARPDELKTFTQQLAPHLSDASAVLAPVRIAWLPRELEGERLARISDLLMLRDPRRPREKLQVRILQTEPERCRLVAAQPATVGNLNDRAKAASDADISNAEGFASFVDRQAHLALERAEYRLIGRRYKMPRLVREQIAASKRFRDGASGLASSLKRSEQSVHTEALGYLQELRTAHSPFAIDLMMQLARGLFTRGYGAQIDYDQAQIERTREALERAPGIILPSHKSNLDSAVTSVAFADNRLAVPTTFGAPGVSGLSRRKAVQP